MPPDQLTARAREQSKLEHFHAIYSQSRAYLIANIISIFLGTLVYAWSAPRLTAAWAACSFFIWGARVWVRSQYPKNGTPKQLHHWNKLWGGWLIASGVSWGAGCAIFYEMATPYQAMCFLLIVVSICLGSIQHISQQVLVHRIYMGVMLCPAILRVPFADHAYNIQMTAVLTIMFALSLTMAKAYRTSMENTVNLKISAELSAEELRIQKEQAVAAQRELAQRSEALQKANTQVGETLEDLRMAQREALERNSKLEAATVALIEQSLTDPLTGLRNRRFLMQQLDGDSAMCARKFRKWLTSADAPAPDQADITFFMIDIDHFKQINDTLGHAAGDAVLVQMKHRLAPLFRGSDYIARWGGEEFLVVARDTNRQQASMLAERIRQSIAGTPFDLPNNQQITRSCSIGFASYPFAPRDPMALPWGQVVEIADQGLYIAKRQGRDGWVGIGYAIDTEPEEGLFQRIIDEPRAAERRGEILIETSLPKHGWQATRAPHAAAIARSLQGKSASAGEESLPDLTDPKSTLSA